MRKDRCRFCRRRVYREISRRMRIGTGCWDDLSPEQQAEQLAEAAARGVPAELLAERQPSPRRPGGPLPRLRRRADTGQLTLLLFTTGQEQEEEDLDEDPPPEA